MSDPDDDDDPVAAVVYSCQGPPVCDFESPEGHNPTEHMSKCLWCKRIYVYKDGREFVEEPSRA